MIIITPCPALHILVVKTLVVKDQWLLDNLSGQFFKRIWNSYLTSFPLALIFVGLEDVILSNCCGHWLRYILSTKLRTSRNFSLVLLTFFVGSLQDHLVRLPWWSIPASINCLQRPRLPFHNSPFYWDTIHAHHNHDMYSPYGQILKVAGMSSLSHAHLVPLLKRFYCEWFHSNSRRYHCGYHAILSRINNPLNPGSPLLVGRRMLRKAASKSSRWVSCRVVFCSAGSAADFNRTLWLLSFRWEMTPCLWPFLYRFRTI